MTTLLPPDFHAVLRQWWTSRFEEPTEAQLEGWHAIRRGDDTLIAAPTGSGKTLAAFLTSIDELFREGLTLASAGIEAAGREGLTLAAGAGESGGEGLERRSLPDEVRVIYVSPLKALSADIHKNLA